VRIIAGEFRGRKLLGPRGQTTRPMTDRVRTALFDTLGQALVGGTVLDLFAGTGILGLEALSRGASRCYFAERDRSALERLRRNIESLGLRRRCEVWPGDVLAILARRLEALAEPVRVAFVDPPYSLTESWSWDHAVERVFAPVARRLEPGGAVVLRCRRNIALPAAFGPLSVRRRRQYGKMAVLLLAPAKGAPAEAEAPPAGPAEGNRT